MAGANVGNLNVKLTLSAEQFAAALMAAGGDVNAFAMKVEAGKGNLKGMDAAAASTATNVKSLTTEIKNYNVASVALRNVSDANRLFQLPRRGTDELIAAGNAQRAAMAGTGAAASQLGGRLTNLAPAMIGLSYAAQDAASQLGTRGLGGAMMAAANNIPAIGLLWGPTGFAVAAGVSVAVQALGSYIDYTERAAKSTKELKDASVAAYGQRLDRVQSSGSSGVRFGRNLADAMQGGTAGMDALAKPLYETITDTTLERNALQGEKLGALARLNNANTRIENEMRFNRETESQVIGRLPNVGKERDDANRQLAEIAERERALTQAREEAEKQLKQIEKAYPQVAKAERERMAKEEEEREKQYRATAADENTRRMKAASQLAPGVGATEAGSAGQFSQIQAAMRAGQDRDMAAQKQIQSNTGKTATNTRDIARKVGKIKAVSLA